MRIVGVTEVLQVMEQIVQEAGEDFIYTAPPAENPDDGGYCRYVYQDQPSCLIAKVLHQLGVPLEVLAQYEKQNIDSAYTHGHSPAWRVDFDVKALHALTVAQRAQDRKGTWGSALEGARRAVASYV